MEYAKPGAEGIMKESQRKHLEKQLLHERERALKALRQLDESVRTGATDDGDLTNYPLHLADEGTDAIEREKGLLLMSQEGRRLNEIDDALRRLYREADEFGRCEGCNGEIRFERLELVPWARLCMDCQQRAETTPTGTAVGEPPG
jgi:DnaK suppressor protein